MTGRVRGFVWMALALSATLSASAPQGRPDFSGTWALAGPSKQFFFENGTPTTFVAPYGRLFTLKHDDKTLTIVTNDGTVTVTLDGTPTKSTFVGGGDSVTTAAWDGVRLIVTTAVAGSQSTRALSLDAHGALRVVTESAPGKPPASFTYKQDRY